MINTINDFIVYHPYTVTGLYVFVGVILGFLIQYLLIGIGKLIYIITRKSADLWVKKIVAYIPVTFFSIWGVYNALIRIISNKEATTFITTTYEVIRTYTIAIIILRLILAVLGRKAKSNNESAASSSIVENVTKIIGYIVIIFVILMQLGISITPILTALGVGSVALALAFQDILSNLFSGIFVLLSSQIKPGDYIKIEDGGDGIEGFVADISWRHTSIRQFAGNYVYVPNSKIATEIITNYRSPDNEYIFSVPFRVGINANLEYAEKTAYEVAKEIQMFEPGAVKNYTPVIRSQSFEEFSIRYTALLKGVTFFDHYALKSLFIKRLQVKFKEAGIEIPYPVTTIKSADGTKKLGY